MKSYLSLIPISAKVHRRQNRMTLLCIVFAVFMVTAVFSMAEMGFGWNRPDWLVSMEVSLLETCSAVPWGKPFFLLRLFCSC